MKISWYKIKFTAILFAAVALTFAYAAAAFADDEIIDLGEMVVEEESLEIKDVIDHPTSFTLVIEPDEFTERSLTLADILDTVQGITVRSMGGLGALSTISIRGLGSENVLVILDGIPLNPSGGAVDMSGIPLNSLERIEIIRGGDSAASGAGASGGVIRLTSIDFEESGESIDSGRFSFGSFNTLTGSFTHRLSENTFSFEASGSAGDFNFLNDNGTSHDVSDDFIDTRVNNEFSSYNTRYSHLWEINDSRQFRAALNYYRSKKGIPGITTFPGANASQSDSRSFAQCNYTDRDFNDGHLDFSLSWLRQARAFNDEYGETTGVPITSSRVNTRYESSIEWVGSGFSMNDVLTAGVSWTHETLTGDSDADRSTFSVRASDEWYVNPDFTITGAFRNDMIDGDSTLSPRIGARYDLSETLFLKTNFGLDFRPPSFEELYRCEGFVVGNPDLVPERTLGFDIGLTESTDTLRIEAVYFNHQTQDLIDYLLISGFRWKPYNIGRARSSGFEISLDWLISPEFELRGNYTRTRAVDISGDGTLQGNPIVGQPSNQAFCELRWHENQWNAFTNWEHRGASPITASGTRFLDPSDAFGFGLGYEFDDSSTIVLEIKNLTGENLTDIRGFPLPGQSWFITWRGDL